MTEFSLNGFKLIHSSTIVWMMTLLVLNEWICSAGIFCSCSYTCCLTLYESHCSTNYYYVQVIVSSRFKSLVDIYIRKWKASFQKLRTVYGHAIQLLKVCIWMKNVLWKNGCVNGSTTPKCCFLQNARLRPMHIFNYNNTCNRLVGTILYVFLTLP